MASRHPRPAPVAAGLQLPSHLHHGPSKAKPANKLLGAPVSVGGRQHDAGTATIAKPCERRRIHGLELAREKLGVALLRGRVGRQEPSLIELVVSPEQNGPQRTKS